MEGNTKILGQQANPMKAPVQHVRATTGEHLSENGSPEDVTPKFHHPPKHVEQDGSNIHLNGRDRELLIQQHLQVFEQCRHRATLRVHMLIPAPTGKEFPPIAIQRPS